MSNAVLTTTFETGLRTASEAMPPSFSRRRILHILSLPDDNWRKQTVLLRAEQEVRDRLGADDSEFSWKEGTVVGATTINWTQILQIIMKLLPLLIALLGGL